jgi:NADPH:quinone reductase-like Zn-dependent oxidoreductase
MGNSPYPAGGLGFSASGRISAVGPNVKNFAVGDRVIGLGSGSFSSHLRTSEALVEKISENTLFEEAATLPAAFATALAALHNAGNLQTGQVSSLRSEQ